MMGVAMKKLIAIALAAVALTGPVYAQSKREAAKTPLQIEDEQKRKEAEKVDKQYKTFMDRNVDQSTAPVRVDPWQNMRGADDSKTKR